MQQKVKFYFKIKFEFIEQFCMECLCCRTIQSNERQNECFSALRPSLSANKHVLRGETFVIFLVQVHKMPLFVYLSRTLTGLNLAQHKPTKPFEVFFLSHYKYKCLGFSHQYNNFISGFKKLSGQWQAIFIFHGDFSCIYSQHY